MGEQAFHSGFVAIVGRPNVGKSTLLNAIIGERIAIISDKPQTTRNSIQGVYTEGGRQIVFVDTPGMHTPKTKLGKAMLRSIAAALEDVDAIVLLIDATDFIGPADKELLSTLSARKAPLFVALNKVDAASRDQVIDRLAQLGAYDGIHEIVPIAALTGEGVDTLRALLMQGLPEGPQYFPEDMVTDQSERAIVAELIREKALLYLRDEIPHGIGVEINEFQTRDNGHVWVKATVYCERESHKGMVIGKQGAMLKTIGAAARQDIEALLQQNVYLELWVKVKKDWRDNERDLRALGYER